MKKKYLNDDFKENFIEIIRERTHHNPQHTIVTASDGMLTYHELEKKSNALAIYLLKTGISPGTLVGLCSSLTTNFIVCLLGILKSGAVYFPLDPALPKEHFHYMLKDGKPSAILVEPHFKHIFKSTHSNIIEINEQIFAKGNISQQPICTINPDEVAYVIYTSGSTGKPKGIMVTHKSLSHIALAHKDYYRSNMKMLVSGGVCFDASLLVIFHALANNCPLYLFNYISSNSSDDILNFIEKNSINYIICVPSFYLKLLKRKEIINSLKCVSLTGENVTKHLCNLHERFAPNAFLYNEYGPSEYAIGTTIGKIYDPELRILSDITFGNPLPNTQVYILDQHLKQVPMGSKGEICISGVGLAKGYLNKKTLTAQKFIILNLSEEKEERFYRTGDQGRFLPNGELEFLGRIDNTAILDDGQLEIGELEYHIARCPEVHQSAVLAKSDPQGKQHLIAYITSASKSAKDSLLLFLKNRIPNRKLPSIIHIENFAYSPNGKIDRDQLVRHE